MSADRDYYRILHVQPDAPSAIVHASYRTLMQRLKNHPDLGGDHERAVLLNEAYAVLSDPERRAAYDLARDIAASQRLRRPEAEDLAAPASDERHATFCCLFCGTVHGLTRPPDRDDDCAECRSPLFPAERHRLEYSGQRMLSRVPRREPVQIFVAWPQVAAFPGELRDLSLNGLRLVAGLRLQPNQIVKIESLAVSALARVAHCTRDTEAHERWAIGAEFLTLRFNRTRGSFVSAKA